MASTALGTSAAYNSFATPGAQGGRLFGQPLSTTHTSYTTAGHDVVHASVHDSKVAPRMSPEVRADLLFAHRGAGPMDERYQSVYQSHFNAGTGRAVQPRVDLTVQKLREQEFGLEAEDVRETSRYRSYRTAASDAFNPQNSVMALRADEAAQRMGATATATGVPPRQLAQSLELNYRKLRLRKD